jgi:hypothetical protein
VNASHRNDVGARSSDKEYHSVLDSAAFDTVTQITPNFILAARNWMSEGRESQTDEAKSIAPLIGPQWCY